MICDRSLSEWTSRNGTFFPSPDIRDFRDYMVQSVMQDFGDDDVSHPYLGEGAARFGRRVVRWNSQGFYDVDELADCQAWRAMGADDRAAAWDEYVRTWFPWGDDDDDE